MGALIVHGGIVRTFDPNNPFAEALAVSDGIVVAVGSLAEVRGSVPQSTPALNAAGGLVTPGLRDAHVHPMYGGLDLMSCNLLDAEPTLHSYVAAIGEYARRHPALDIVVGGGWAMEAFPGGRPTAQMLDLAVLDRPCVLVNRDRHGVWVNTAALRAAGLNAHTADPAGGYLERDAVGNPTGLLHERAAELVSVLMPYSDHEYLEKALLAAQSHLHSLGITGWQDAIVGKYLGYPDPFPVYQSLDDAGLLTAYVGGALWWDYRRGPEQIPELLSRRAEGSAGTRFRATTIKIMVDGIVENQTASMLLPYMHSHDHSGSAFVDPGALKEAVAALDAEQFQVHMHTIGDRATRSALDAIAALDSPTANRHQLAHLEIVNPEDVPRFADLGAIANAQMLWACPDPQLTDLTLPIMGPERSTHMYPFGDLVRAGARLAAGSDWPVSTAHPFEQIAVGVTRVGAGLEHLDPFLPEQAISLDEAIRAFTEGSSFADRRDEVGVVAPGRRADLTIFDRNPYAEKHDTNLASIQASATIVEGDVVWSRN